MLTPEELIEKRFRFLYKLYEKSEGSEVGSSTFFM